MMIAMVVTVLLLFLAMLDVSVILYYNHAVLQITLNSVA